MPIKNLWVFQATKLKILSVLFQYQGDVCGLDLTKQLGISKNILSYHISTLKKHKFLNEVKCGNKKNYTINPENKELIRKILESVDLIDNN